MIQTYIHISALKSHTKNDVTNICRNKLKMLPPFYVFTVVRNSTYYAKVSYCPMVAI